MHVRRGGSEAIFVGGAIDVAKVKPGIVDLVLYELDARPKVRALVLECTELPPYADALRAASNLPVLDGITIVDFFHSAVADNPFLGLNFEVLLQQPGLDA